MITANIQLGKGIKIDKSSNINNINIGDDARIAHSVRVFGAEEHVLELGKGSYVGPNCFIDGFNAKVKIGNFVSFAPNVHLISGSGPNASLKMQKVFPIVKGEVTIGDHTWIGANVVIMPNVTVGKCCIIAVNSFVNKSFPDYSIIGGTPAKLIRTMTPEEIEKLNSND
jgi:acetyltransferase-like isoleucine patch superfamily enzyme